MKGKTNGAARAKAAREATTKARENIIDEEVRWVKRVCECGYVGQKCRLENGETLETLERLYTFCPAESRSVI